MLRRYYKPVMLILATAGVVMLVAMEPTPLVRGPAPYPPEWQWLRRPKATIHRAGPAVTCAGGLIGLLALAGGSFVRRRPRASAGVLLAGATVLGFALQWGLLKLEEEDALPTLFRRTISDTFTSYFLVSVTPDARDVGALLDRYADLLPGFREKARHAATHPPGPILYYRGWLAVCESSPRLTTLTVDRLARPNLDMRLFRLPAEGPMLAAALLGALGWGLLGAATCWPVAWLARTAGLAAPAAIRAGILWTLLPAAALMVPTLDLALALPVAMSTALLARGLAVGRLRHAGAAGVFGGIAGFFSYGAVAFLVVGWAAAACLTAWNPPGKRRVFVAVGVAVSVAIAIHAAPAWWGYAPLETARRALAIHRWDYTSQRSYLLWLLFNPWDLVLFLGVPIVLLGARRTLGAMAAAAQAGSFHLLTPVCRFQAVVAAGLLLLLLSGTVRGEAGRIFLPLMPLLLVAALAKVPESSQGPTAGAAGPCGPSAAEAVMLGGLLFGLDLTVRLCWYVP